MISIALQFALHLYLMARYFILTTLFFYFVLQPLQAQFKYAPLPASVDPIEQIVLNSEDNRNLSMPITMQGPGLFAVHTFTFVIQFNSSKLHFEGVDALAVSNVSASANGNTLLLNWNNPGSPVSFVENTHVLDIQFSRLEAGDVAFTFLPGSKVGSYAGLLPVTYTNGNLLQTWELSLESVPVQGGFTSGSGDYLPGQVVALQATPNNGYLFENWTQNGQIVSNSPGINYSMPNANAHLKANFAAKSYQVSLQSVPGNGGSTTGAGIYDFGQNVNLNAIAATGYQFINWTKDGEIVSTSPQYSFSMPAGDLSLWANFEAVQYTLTLTPNPAEGGTVSGGGSYLYNQNVTINATASTGYHFVAWTQNGTVLSENPIFTFNMPANGLQLTARFLINTYTIAVQTNNPDFGSVSGGGNFTHGTTVNLQAIPVEEYAFVAWTEAGQPVSFDANYSFTATNDRSLTAFFHLMSSCPTPINLQLNDLSDSTAAFTWLSPVSINQWNCLWGQALGDTLASEGVLVETIQNSIVLNNLSPNTIYVAYVQSHCPDDGLSIWSEPLFFTTHYVDIKEVNPSKNWRIAPNPSRGKIVLSHPNLNNLSLEIQLYTLTGQLLHTQVIPFNHSTELDFQHLENGFYILKVNGKGVSLQHKLIISK